MFENYREIGPDDMAGRTEIAKRADSLELTIGDAWWLGVTVVLLSTGGEAVSIRWSSRNGDIEGESEAKLDVAELVSKLEIESWDPCYDEPGVLDGMTWSVRVGAGDIFFGSRGCNAWPSGLESLVDALRPFVPDSIDDEMRRKLH